MIYIVLIPVTTLILGWSEISKSCQDWSELNIKISVYEMSNEENIQNLVAYK